MYICFDCKIESENPSGWYAEYATEGDEIYRIDPEHDAYQIMRCRSCGKKEESRRYELHFGDKQRLSIEEVDKQNRIQFAKDLREAGLSAWTYIQK